MARGRVAGSPTITLLVAFVAVYALQEALAALAGPVLAASLFTLSAPLARAPWTLLTSVLAHGSLSHLLANAVGLALVGLPVERRTTPARFYAFFFATGALAGVAEVWSAAFLGLLPGASGAVGVLGASGAVFALAGYLLAGNALTERVFGSVQLSVRAQVVLFVIVAVAVTALTASPEVALVAHFTGLLAGLVGGRAHLLRPRRRGTGAEPA